MGRSLTGSVFTQAELSNQVILHPGNFSGYTLLQELEDIVNRDPRFLYEDQVEYDLLEAGDEDLFKSSVTSMRHIYMAQAIGAATFMVSWVWGTQRTGWRQHYFEWSWTMNQSCKSQQVAHTRRALL